MILIKILHVRMYTKYLPLLIFEQYIWMIKSWLTDRFYVFSFSRKESATIKDERFGMYM